MTGRSYHTIIEPEYSSLSIELLNLSIRYSIEDVLTLTYLHKPITRAWLVTQEMTQPINYDFFLTNQLTVSIDSPFDHECISGDQEQDHDNNIKTK